MISMPSTKSSTLIFGNSPGILAFLITSKEKLGIILLKSLKGKSSKTA